jgi:hypothetical protein
MRPIGGPAPRRTGRRTVGRNITWTWTCVIALQITDPFSRQRGRPTWKRKEVIVTQRGNVTSGHPLQKGHDTKTNWPTDRQSQYIWTRSWKAVSWSKRSAVEGQLQKDEDLSVCSGASKMELMTALWVKNRCVCAAGIVREPRKGNVWRWKPIPKTGEGQG